MAQARVGNYLYGLNWVFWPDGRLELELELTGILLTRELERSGVYRKRVPTIVKQAWVFAYVCFAWIFFRAASLSDAMLIVRRIFTESHNARSLTTIAHGLNRDGIPSPPVTLSGSNNSITNAFPLPNFGFVYQPEESSVSYGIGVISFGGFAAELSSASTAPVKQRAKASKPRGFKNPNWEAGFSFTGIVELH